MHLPHTLPAGMYNDTAALENSFAVPQKVKHTVSTWPSNSTPGIHPRKIKTYVHTKISTWMFIATIFIIARGQTIYKSVND